MTSTRRAVFPHFFLSPAFSPFCILNHNWELTNDLFTAFGMLTRCGSDECCARSILDACQSSDAHTAVLTVQILVPMLFQVWRHQCAPKSQFPWKQASQYAESGHSVKKSRETPILVLICVLLNVTNFVIFRFLSQLETWTYQHYFWSYLLTNGIWSIWECHGSLAAVWKHSVPTYKCWFCLFDRTSSSISVQPGIFVNES